MVAGSTYYLNQVTLSILSDPTNYGDGLNNTSFAIKVTNGNHRFLMYGDGENKMERDLLKSGVDLSADVLLLAHHGSQTSTSDEILNAVNPKEVVISVGYQNKYNLPREKTMTKVWERKLPVRRTDLQNTIIAYSDGTNITWNVEKTSDYRSGYDINGKE